MQEMYATEDNPMVRKTAHGLKSAAKSMGALILSQHFLQIENAANETPETLTALFAETEIAFNDVKAILERYVKHSVEPQP